jgi:hypothetical protein
MKFITGVFVLIAFFSSSQDSLKIDLGSIDDSIYTNSFFGLSYKIPANWHIKSEEEIADLIDEVNASGLFYVRADFKSSLVLFLGKERDYDLYGDINSTFMVSTCSKNLDYVDIRTCMALINYINKANRTVLPADAYVEDIVHENLGGLDFYVSETVIPLGDGTNLHQKHYVREFGEVYLDITLLYHEDEDNEALFDAFGSIEFEESK